MYVVNWNAATKKQIMLRELRDSSNEPSTSDGNVAEKICHNEKISGDGEKENEENGRTALLEPNALARFTRNKLQDPSQGQSTSSAGCGKNVLQSQRYNYHYQKLAEQLVAQEHSYCKQKPPAEGSLQGILQSYYKPLKIKTFEKAKVDKRDKGVKAPQTVKIRVHSCEVPVCKQTSPNKQLFPISTILITRTEVYLRLRWTYDYYSPKSINTNILFCEDHYDASDFVDPTARPLQLKPGVLPHLLRLRLWKSGKWDWVEYAPGCPYALDKPPAETPKMIIKKMKRKLREGYDLKDAIPKEDAPPCSKEAKICNGKSTCNCGVPFDEVPSEEESEKEEAIYYDDDDDDEEDIAEVENPTVEPNSDAESWKDSDLEEEEFKKITEEAIHTGRSVRTRRDCKITDWQLLPSNLFIPKAEKPPKAKKPEVEAEESILQYVPPSGKPDEIAGKEQPRLEMTSKCHYCDEWFPNTGLRGRHMRKVHPEYSNFICGLCRKKLGNTRTFYQHMWNHMKSAHQCEFCDKQFVTKKNYKLHHAKHLADAAENAKIKCPVCSECVDSEDVLATHMLGHGPQETENNADECHESDMLLEDFDFLSAAEGAECNQKSPGKAPSFTITVLEDLTGLPAEAAQQVFQCPNCFKLLESQQHLTVHMMNHGLTYKCDSCSMTIEGWDNIQQHMLSHVGPDFSHLVTKNL